MNEKSEYLEMNMNNFISINWLKRTDEKSKDKIKQFQNYLLSALTPSEWILDN